MFKEQIYDFTKNNSLLSNLEVNTTFGLKTMVYRRTHKEYIESHPKEIKEEVEKEEKEIKKENKKGKKGKNQYKKRTEDEKNKLQKEDNQNVKKEQNNPDIVSDQNNIIMTDSNSNNELNINSSNIINTNRNANKPVVKSKHKIKIEDKAILDIIESAYDLNAVEKFLCESEVIKYDMYFNNIVIQLVKKKINAYIKFIFDTDGKKEHEEIKDRVKQKGNEIKDILKSNESFSPIKYSNETACINSFICIKDIFFSFYCSDKHIKKDNPHILKSLMFLYQSEFILDFCKEIKKIIESKLNNSFISWDNIEKNNKLMQSSLVCNKIYGLMKRFNNENCANEFQKNENYFDLNFEKIIACKLYQNALCFNAEKDKGFIEDLKGNENCLNNKVKKNGLVSNIKRNINLKHKELIKRKNKIYECDVRVDNINKKMKSKIGLFNTMYGANTIEVINDFLKED